MENELGRENFFDNYNLIVKVNDFIRANQKVFNESIVDSIGNIIPEHHSVGVSGLL